MPSDDQFRAWCRRIKASDRDAFAEVFDVLHDPLARYALQLTGRKSVAQDVVQHAFTALWDMRSSLNPDESLEALLFRTGPTTTAGTGEREPRTTRPCSETWTPCGKLPRRTWTPNASTTTCGRGSMSFRTGSARP